MTCMAVADTLSDSKCFGRVYLGVMVCDNICVSGGGSRWQHRKQHRVLNPVIQGTPVITTFSIYFHGNNPEY